jgi:restriction system protein
MADLPEAAALSILLIGGGFVLSAASNPIKVGYKRWIDKARERENRAAFLRSAAQAREIAEMNRAEEERRQREKRTLEAFGDNHRRALARRRAQLVHDDGYGNAITKKWDKERRYFVTTVFLPFLIERGYAYSGDLDCYRILHAPRKGEFVSAEGTARLRRFDDWVEAWALSPDTIDLDGVATGQDYERFCANLLRQAGWSASLTKASGDQGADIIAEIARLRIVCQCKFYNSGPVGNKAVQEVVAARLHEGASAAVVISNAPFTPSAQALAQTTRVVLIHHENIPRLKEMLS